MTDEEIIEMAKQAECIKDYIEPYPLVKQQIIAFARLIEKQTQKNLRKADTKFDKRVAGEYGNVKEL
jgi:hypothetical protein